MKALLRPLQQAFSPRWQQLVVREKTAVLLAGAVVGLALFWSLLLAPAWRTLSAASAQHAALNAQLQQMQQIQTQVTALRALPAPGRAERLQALQQTLQPLGANVELQVAGNQATLVLREVSSEALAQWLVQLRTQGQSQASSVRLRRHDLASPTATWDGTLGFTLGAN